MQLENFYVDWIIKIKSSSSSILKKEADRIKKNSMQEITHVRK